MENETGRNTDFRKVAGVLAWLAGVAGPLLGIAGVFSRQPDNSIMIGAVIGYATFIVGTLLFFSLRGKGPGIALLVFAVIAFLAGMFTGAGSLRFFAAMVLTAGVIALYGQKMGSKAQRMAAAAKRPDTGDTSV